MSCFTKEVPGHYGSDTEDMELWLMELDRGSNLVAGKESKRAILPTVSREEEPSDRLEPTEPMDFLTLLPEIGVQVT